MNFFFQYRLLLNIAPDVLLLTSQNAVSQVNLYKNQNRTEAS